MLFALDPKNPDAPFPHADQAEVEPDGLLALGGDLSVPRLLNAYRHGIFPWYSEGQPILWWSPNPRMILLPQHLKVSRSLKKTLRSHSVTATFDRDFGGVIRACAAPRPDQQGTWILPEMIFAYTELHRAGHAHSVEIWAGNQLVGGLYGVAVGKVFFGESMFSRISNASKIALVHLTNKLLEWDYRMIDCQIHTPHLKRLGATEISRDVFLRNLDRWCTAACSANAWSTADPVHPKIPES